jgi:iron complex outermembrane recepter protein
MPPGWVARLVLLLCAGPACFAQTGSVAGRVLDAETGDPLPSAHVVLVGTERGATTGDEGRFRLDGLPAGTHRLRASFVGFTAQEQVVDVVATRTAEVTFALVPEAPGEEVLVTADRLRSVGRTRALPHLVPQAVSVLTEAQLRAQAAVDVEEALRNVSGVVLAGREQPFGTFTLRGFPADGTGTFRRNGIEIAHYADALRANVVQVEVLKGPASVLYGRLEPGGVVNFVTRQPRCAEAVRRVEGIAGAHATVSARGTFAPACTDAQPHFVLDASAERRDSFRDGMTQETAFLSGAARHLVATRTRLTVDAEYDVSGAALDPGVALPGADVPDGFDRRVYFGEPDARYRWRSGFASAAAEHHLERAALRTVTSRIAYGSYRHVRDMVKLDSLTAAGMIARSLTADDTHYRYLYGEVSADGEVVTGPVSHELVVGLEGTRLAIDVTGRAPLRQAGGTFRFASIDPVALADPQPTGLPSEDHLIEYVTATGSGLNLGAFAQNRARVATPAGELHAVVSARLAHVTAGVEWFALAATPDTPAGLNERHVSLTALTPAFALLLAPTPGLSLYGSYGTSFNPIFQQVDAEGQPFEPTRGEQFEAGVKLERERLSTTLAAFDIRKRGALSRAASGFYVQTGAQRSRGIELDVAGSPVRRLTLLGAYTLLDAVVTTDEAIPVGNRLPAAPRHSGRLWATYVVATSGARGLDLNLGLQVVGERFASLGNELLLPAYRLVDAGVTYHAGTRFEVQLIGENLLDEHYLVGAELRGGGEQAIVAGWPGAPRGVRVRVTASF